jgi:FKBP-type peptidyl-prolyl cis-trans isomerase
MPRFQFPVITLLVAASLAGGGCASSHTSSSSGPAGGANSSTSATSATSGTSSTSSTPATSGSGEAATSARSSTPVAAGTPSGSAPATAPSTPAAAVAPEGAASDQAPNPARLHRLASGLVYEDIVVGDGKMADPGLTAIVHYTGWLKNGTKFDSSLDRDQPFRFEIGAGQVIRGWDEGVKGMRVGGKRRLTIPPDLGYGAAGAGGVIPPNATLVFDVQLLGVQ